MFKKLRARKKVPSYIITRNGEGNLCAVVTVFSMVRRYTAVQMRGSDKLYPEIQWPAAWVPYPCNEKKAILKLTAGNVAYGWDGMRWVCVGSVCAEAREGLFPARNKRKASYYGLEYLTTPRGK